jgi:hypothetical protein
MKLDHNNASEGPEAPGDFNEIVHHEKKMIKND